MNIYRFLYRLYDLVEVIWFSDIGRNPREELVRLIPDKKLKILDLCCGTGTNGIAIADKNPDNRILGIDKERRMLYIGKKKIEELKLENIKLKLSDAFSSRLKANQFDYVLLSLILHECDDELREKFLNEAKRLLKVKGHLIVVEWERQKSFFKWLKFIPLYLLEISTDKDFKKFYNMNKRKYFEEHGFKVLGQVHCNYTVIYDLELADEKDELS